MGRGRSVDATYLKHTGKVISLIASSCEKHGRYNRAGNARRTILFSSRRKNRRITQTRRLPLSQHDVTTNNRIVRVTEPDAVMSQRRPLRGRPSGVANKSAKRPERPRDRFISRAAPSQCITSLIIGRRRGRGGWKSSLAANSLRNFAQVGGQTERRKRGACRNADERI